MMKKNKKYSLVKGKFTPLDAKSVLFALINSKINFHAMESFSITIRSGGDVSHHTTRIKQLRKVSSDVSKLIDFASKNKLSLDIKGDIEIKLINNRE